MKQASEEATNPDEIQTPLFGGNRQILSQQEEDVLLDWIHSRHCNGNCPHRTTCESMRRQSISTKLKPKLHARWFGGEVSSAGIRTGPKLECAPLQKWPR
jgi:hypothetical protein